MYIILDKLESIVCRKLPKTFSPNHLFAEQETSEGFFHKQLIGKALFLKVRYIQCFS